MHLLTELIEDSMPKTRNEMPVSIRQFHQYRHELSTTDGVAIYKNRIITPPATRQTQKYHQQCVYCDFIPVIPGKYLPHDTWRDKLRAREDALCKRHIKTNEYWSEHTRRMPALTVGDYVRIQNQTGQHPNKWDRTGTVVEVKQHDQYQVQVDGSGRITLRNRRFLRKFIPFPSPEPPRPIDVNLGMRLACDI